MVGRLVLLGVLVLGQAAGAAVQKPPQFEPAAVSFVSPSQGWALGRFGCDDCAAIRSTVDGGRHWTVLPSPHLPLRYYASSAWAVSDIAFADASNGFLFGPGFLTTRDGGRAWSRQRLSSVFAVAFGGGYAYAQTRPSGPGGAALWRARIGSQAWRQLPLPPTARVALAAVEGSSVVLLESGETDIGVMARTVGRLWASSDSGSSWRPRRVPCTPADGGAAVIAIAHAHPRSWLLDCFDNEQSSQEQDTQHHLYATANAGESWSRLSDPTRYGAPALLTDNGVGHAFLTTEGVRDALVGTLDGGRHWHHILYSGGSFFAWADLDFVTTETGFVVGPTHSAPEHVYRTDDGGRTWRVLPVG